MVNLIRRQVTATDGESLQSIIDDIVRVYGEIALSDIILDVYDEAYFSFKSPEMDIEKKARLSREKNARIREQQRLAKEKEKERELFLQLKAKYEPADSNSP
jgi:hypothetical protein